MNQKILIIGGMGPQAGLALHERIINKAVELGAKHGDDFPNITHVSIPVPEFIETESSKLRALDVIKEHLYCLWQSGFYPYSHSL